MKLPSFLTILSILLGCQFAIAMILPQLALKSAVQASLARAGGSTSMAAMRNIGTTTPALVRNAMQPSLPKYNPATAIGKMTNPLPTSIPTGSSAPISGISGASKGAALPGQHVSNAQRIGVYAAAAATLGFAFSPFSEYLGPEFVD